jgi:predicted flap endonuclease-1-like 5' DNA nuclease
MTNQELAAKLERVAALLDAQGANLFRVAAYRRASETVRQLGTPLINIVRHEGPGALDDLPGIGPQLARTLADAVLSGRLAMLERLEGTLDPEAILRTVPGIGPRLAERLHHELGIATLEELELAAHDGRLTALAGIGPRRGAGIAAALGSRLARPRGGGRAGEPPPVAELLDVDAEYRRKAGAGELAMITPRRFNPKHEAWLPVLHAVREPRHYTALFSNTARAHQLGTTQDWVVVYVDGGKGEQQYTVVTAHSGSLRGKRVVRGRELECERHYTTK